MRLSPGHSSLDLSARFARVWLVYLGVCAVGCAAFVLGHSLVSDTVISMVLLGSAPAVIAVVIRVYRPAPLWFWLLVAGAVTFWFVVWVLWQSYVAGHDGVPPYLSSWRNFLFLGFYPLIAAVLLGLLHRREGRAVGSLETAIIATSGLAIAWIVLGRRYAHDHHLTVGARVVQILFLLGDVVTAAATVRLLLSSGRRSPSFVLLLAAPVAVVYSDFIWNWTTELGHYSPGSWADIGWLAVGPLLATAAVHPSMGELYRPAQETARQLSHAGFASLIAASLIVPATVVVTALSRFAESDVVVIALFGGLLTLLILVRMALVAREEARLGTALADQNERLLELDRMKEDFVASVSHELRTPLTSIRGYLEIVQAGQVGELNEEQARFLGIVERNAERLLRVVGDLLFAAQVGAGKIELTLEDVDIEEICQHAALAAAPHLESKQLKFVERIEPLPPMRADPARLGQVVDNLLSNAIKFTRPGGQVSLDAFSRGGTTILEIKDTGVGMTAREQGQLFQRFYRTEASVDQGIQGTGLGLSIVKAIVEAHAGSITVLSTHGEGTTFRLEFPVVTQTETRVTT